MSWQDQILRDIDINTAESVVESIITTSKYMDDRNYPAEAIAMLKWHGYAYTYVGGAGGNSTGSSGVPGEAPGGGGQGGDSQLFSTNGANGGAGGVYLYVY